MKRDWKPGDVALVGYRPHEEAAILRSDNRWYGATGWVLNDPLVAVSIRPLLIIDPELTPEETRQRQLDDADDRSCDWKDGE